MKKIAYVISFLVYSSVVMNAQQVASKDFQSLLIAAEKSLEKGIHFYQTLAIEGGFVYFYTLDGKEKWGEGKTDDRTSDDCSICR